MNGFHRAKELAKDLAVQALSVLLTPRVRALLCDPRYFRTWEKRGLHITPVHYYQAVPDTGLLENYDWGRRYDLTGLAFDAAAQEKLLAELSASYRAEYSGFPLEPAPGAEFFVRNGTFESVDCEMFYCLVRRHKPRRIVEIGAGNSTRLARLALAKNLAADKAPGSLLSIEPFPAPDLPEPVPGFAELRRRRLEEVGEEAFSGLGENDILFIDSSHVLKTGNDVSRIYLEILPRLRPGVLVHIHDIFLPAEYPRETVMERRRFWTEQYLVQAFLAFNGAFDVLWAGHFMHLSCPAALEAAFPSYDRALTRPGSLWLRRAR